jgi:hypothetical protein
MSELHRWTDRDGQEWACQAYDHGPFCRLCVPVNDGMLQGCLDNVERGYFEIVQQDADGFRFKVTSDGERAVKGLLGEN